MGMITRVRGRLRSVHTLPKLDEKMRNEKIAETVCLLSVLFLLPYCSRGHAPLLLSLGSWFVTTYSFLVLPILISANYKYPVRWLRHIISKLPGVVRKYSKPTWKVIRKLYAPVGKCENSFMKMKNISNLVTQLVFFMLCDRALLCNQHRTEKKVTGLYSLMFYNVIAYCVSYIKELIEKEDWSITVNMTQHSNIKHLTMSATKIVLEWTKAVTFIITVTFMLLVFGLEQGLEHYRPTMLYTFITWTYFMCTEKVFVDLFLPALLLLKIKSLEALEQFYAPVFLRYYTITLASLLVICQVLFHGQLYFTLFAFYVTIYLKVKETRYGCLTMLKREQSMLGQFRYATQEEIDNCDDVCAVCLCQMDRARVTPCQHMFHACCLRECLNNSNNCPICKREYVFVH
ncbi:hypothetical protein ABEB36_006521 [Hypothenemus hampei]|uniref:RING-type domain-containing protein n=1 Tax=Hypothenemus hampei TaxID=57062 RepID=A0ABD1EQT8_HYPHA